MIWAGNKKYQLTGITETELDWLVNELSDWLELPVQNRIIPVIEQNDY